MENLKVRSAECGVRRLLALLVAFLFSLPAGAADITRGITFSDGQRLTAANLHSLVDSATIGAAFLTGKDVLSTVDNADYVLIYDTSTGTYKKMTLAVLIMANTGLITTQSDEPSPAGGDYLLLYDASANSLAKVSVTNLVNGNTNLIAAQYPITNLLGTAQILVSNGGTNNRISLANLWALNFEYTRGFTNQLEHTAPTNTDRLLIWDATAGTNKWTTLLGLNTNLPVAVSPTNTATLTLYETGQVKRVSVTNLQQSFAGSGVFLTTNQTFTSSSVGLGSISGAGPVLDVAHGMTGVPTTVMGKLVCTTAEYGYSIGDEVAVEHINTVLGNRTVIVGGNSTNVFAIATGAPGGSWAIEDKSTGAGGNVLTVGRWSLRLTARP